MKLELKHLAPYLPYDVKIYFETLDGRHSDYWTLTSDKIEFCLDNKNKPILHPLSELTIEDAREHNYPDEGHLERSLLKGHASYEVWNEYVKEHFDVFGLIEKGLAIDINTLNQ